MCVGGKQWLGDVSLKNRSKELMRGRQVQTVKQKADQNLLYRSEPTLFGRVRRLGLQLCTFSWRCHLAVSPQAEGSGLAIGELLGEASGVDSFEFDSGPCVSGNCYHAHRKDAAVAAENPKRGSAKF